MSVCLSVCLAFLLGGRQPTWPGSLLHNNGNCGPIVGTLLHNSGNQGHRCSTLLHKWQAVQQWQILLHNSGIWYRCWYILCNSYPGSQHNSDLRTLLEHSVAQQWIWLALVQQWPMWCGVKNTFGMSVYSKEYTFPVLHNYPAIFTGVSLVMWSVINMEFWRFIKLSFICNQNFQCMKCN
jgi:hypothetical protein